ncbi:MAG: murein biosynthesis integral membrane protein MurJ [Oligoflexia bacterium]|nr:murein biosynthesis integral membrane protein MurJ [Oligoflexia bacterium]
MSVENSQTRRRFYGATGLIALGTFSSRILGLVREQVFAYFFGAGFATDAFQIAFRIPNLLRDLFAEGAMSSALVPVYAQAKKKKGEEYGWELVRSAITLLVLVLSVICLLGILGSDLLVSLIAPAFKSVEGKHELAVLMTKILWPFLLLVVLAAIWMGILNARDRYGPPAFAPLLFNVVSIISAFTFCPLGVWLFGWHPIVGMAVGATLGGCMQWLIQVPALQKEGFRFKPSFDFKNPELKKIIILMGAGTFGLAATQINVLVNSILASGQGDGAISWLNYAFRLMQFPIGVFGVAIATANLTRVSNNVADGDFDSVRASIKDALQMVFVLTIPSAVGLAVMGTPIISVIYEHGRFSAEDTFNSALALAGYSLGLTAYSAIKVLVPVLYSLGKAKAAILSSGLSVALNIVLSILLVQSLGFYGLALATSVAAFLNFFVLLYLMQKYIKQIDFMSLGLCFSKVMISSLGMAIIVYIGMQFVGIRPMHAISLTSYWVNATFLVRISFLLVCIMAGVLCYGIIAHYLGIKEVNKVRELLWKRIMKVRGEGR